MELKRKVARSALMLVIEWRRLPFGFFKHAHKTGFRALSGFTTLIMNYYSRYDPVEQRIDYNGY
jgi:hypothetical protein